MSLSASCQCRDVDTKGFFMRPVNGVRRERSERDEGRDTHQCMMNARKAPLPSLLAVLWRRGGGL